MDVAYCGDALHHTYYYYCRDGCHWFRDQVCVEQILHAITYLTDGNVSFVVLLGHLRLNFLYSLPIH